MLCKARAESREYLPAGAQRGRFQSGRGFLTGRAVRKSQSMSPTDGHTENPLLTVSRNAERARLGVALVVLVLTGLHPLGARCEKRAIDPAHSVLKIRVFKSGLFSGFAHDHEIIAPIAEGMVEDAAPAAVRFSVGAGKLRVLDPELSADKRAEVQKTMEGPEVLDVARFPEIRFQSNGIEQTATARWTVRGDLTLHGQTRPLVVQVALNDGRYQGTVSLKQREFGIKPVRIAGGTIKVKDEVQIDFEITLGQP